MASFMMGQISTGAPYGSTYEIQFEPATESFQFAGYVQDNWKVNAKVNVESGTALRRESPRTERYNRMNWFNPERGQSDKWRHHYLSPIRSLEIR